jgi:hypothetical protein
LAKAFDFSLQEDHLLRRRALVADLLAADLAAGEQRRDLVGVLDAPGVDALQVAGGDDLRQREVLGVDEVEAPGRGDDALGHLVGVDGHVLDLDARVGLEALGDRLVLVDRSAEVAQDDLLLRMHRREHAGGEDAGRALEHGAAGRVLLAHGLLL